MKSVLIRTTLFIFFLLATSLFAQEDSTKCSSPNPRKHKGYYSNSSYGLSYISYLTDEYDASQSHMWLNTYDFQGFAPALDFKVGMALANLIAFHTDYGFSF